MHCHCNTCNAAFIATHTAPVIVANVILILPHIDSVSHSEMAKDVIEIGRTQSKEQQRVLSEKQAAAEQLRRELDSQLRLTAQVQTAERKYLEQLSTASQDLGKQHAANTKLRIERDRALKRTEVARASPVYTHLQLSHTLCSTELMITQLLCAVCLADRDCVLL